MFGGGNLTKRIIVSPGYREMQISIAKQSGGSTVTVLANGILECRTTSTTNPAYAFYNLWLPPGSYAEVICEMKAVSGTNTGGIGYNQYSSDEAVIGGTLKDTVNCDSTYWKPYKMIIPADIANPFTSIMFGVWNGGTGTYHFRNLEINVYNGSLISPDIRLGRILGGGLSWSWEEQQNGQNAYGLNTITVAGSGELVVYYEEFRGWGNPLIFAQMQVQGGRNGYTVHVTNVESHRCWLRICDRAGNEVNAQDLTGLNAIEFLAIGV